MLREALRCTRRQMIGSRCATCCCCRASDALSDVDDYAIYGLWLRLMPPRYAAIAPCERLMIMPWRDTLIFRYATFRYAAADAADDRCLRHAAYAEMLTDTRCF